MSTLLWLVGLVAAMGGVICTYMQSIPVPSPTETPSFVEEHKEELLVAHLARDVDVWPIDFVTYDVNSSYPFITGVYPNEEEITAVKEEAL